MNWMSIVIIVILILSALNGYRHGFLRVVFTLLSIVITIFLVSKATPYVSRFLEENTPIYNTIKEKCENVFQVDPSQFNSENVPDQVSAIANYPLPDSVKKLLMENNNAEVYKMLDITGFDEYVGAYIAKIALNVISFIASFIIISIILKIVMLAIDIVAKLPVIRGFNRIAGMAAGLLEGLILIWIGFLLITLFSGSEIGVSLFKAVNESSIASFLYNQNYLLKMVTVLMVKG